VTGPEHYRWAASRVSAARNETDPQWAAVQARLAIAEALLALTAATALPPGGPDSASRGEWVRAVAGL